MCPACLSTVALIAVGAGSTGGLTAWLWSRKRRHGKSRETATTPTQENPR